MNTPIAALHRLCPIARLVPLVATAACLVGCASPCAHVSEGCMELLLSLDDNSQPSLANVGFELSLMSAPTEAARPTPARLASQRIAQLQIPARLRIDRPAQAADRLVTALTATASTQSGGALIAELPLMWAAGEQIHAQLQLTEKKEPPAPPPSPLPTFLLATGRSPAVLPLPSQGDGAPVLLLVNDEEGLSALRPTPDGRTGNRTPILSSLGVRFSAVALGDVDRDGFVDIIACNENRDTLYRLPGRKGGDFGEPFQLRQIGGAALRAPTLVDLDLDGLLDLVVLDQANNQFLLLYGEATSAWFGKPTMVGSGGKGPHLLAAAKLDYDPYPDLIIGHEFDGTVVGFFTGGIPVPLAPNLMDSGQQPRAVVVAKLDDDDRPDVAIAYAGAEDDSSPGVLHLWQGRADGRFAVLEPASELPPALTDLQVADVDNNRVPDLLTLHAPRGRAGDERLHILLRGPTRHVTFALAAGDGPSRPGVPHNASHLMLIDIGGDGLPDAILSGGTSGTRALLNIPRALR